MSTPDPRTADAPALFAAPSTEVASSTGVAPSAEAVSAAGTGRPRPTGAAVVAAAVDLFESAGFEATSVAEIAAAVGVSRATFFRQVGTKEDAIFADHPQMLEDLEQHLAAQLAHPGADPWAVIGAEPLMVFDHLTRDPALARRRYRVVRAEAVLRDREIVTERRYEQIFDRALRSSSPQADPLESVCFAAALTAAHNHELRALLRAEDGDPAAARRRLRSALEMLRRRMTRDAPAGGDAAGDAHSRRVMVASFPAGADPEEVLRGVREQLSRDAAERNAADTEYHYP